MLPNQSQRDPATNTNSTNTNTYSYWLITPGLKLGIKLQDYRITSHKAKVNNNPSSLPELQQSAGQQDVRDYLAAGKLGCYKVATAGRLGR